MKLILEYSAYNVLKDESNYEFLKKVKNENPDLYSKFMNIVIKKGLEYAKKEYIEYDPDFIKYKNKIEKFNNTREQRIKNKKENKEKILSYYSESISKIKNILGNNIQMDNIKKIINNENISRVIKDLNLKKKYRTDLLKILKSPKEIYFRSFIAVCTLSYKGEDRYADYHFNNYSYIKISQYYRNNLYYKLTLNIYVDDIIRDIIKENNYELNNIDNYIKFVNFSIYKLSSSLVQPYDNIIEKLERLSYILSIKSYEDWMLKNNVKKYNI